jgi:hypothetical protein
MDDRGKPSHSSTEDELEHDDHAEDQRDGHQQTGTTSVRACVRASFPLANTRGPVGGAALMSSAAVPASASAAMRTLT